MNISALRELMEALKQEPRRLNMETFACPIDSIEGDFGADWSPDSPRFRPPCGTVMCIAGTQAYLRLVKEGSLKLGDSPSDDLLDDMNRYAPSIAREDLGLTWEESDRLFYFKSWGMRGGGWPEEFEARYYAARTPEERLAVTLERMELFIATGGAE